MIDGDDILEQLDIVAWECPNCAFRVTSRARKLLREHSCALCHCGNMKIVDLAPVAADLPPVGSA